MDNDMDLFVQLAEKLASKYGKISITAMDGDMYTRTSIKVPGDVLKTTWKKKGGERIGV